MNNYKTIDQLLSENPNLQMAVGFLIEAIIISPGISNTILSKWDEIRALDKKNKEMYD
jgi:hypothetical protein